MRSVAVPIIPKHSSAAGEIRMKAVIERLGLHLRTGVLSQPQYFFNLCLSLARGIDYALTNNDVPATVHDLPLLIKQVYHCKNEFFQSAIMVLMISVKNACRSGWFGVVDTDELLTLANEISSSFCSTNNTNVEVNNAVDVISEIMRRFYPQLKIGCILVSLEAKSGYEVLVADFYIAKNMILAAQEKIRLFVAQTDNIDTSSCIISPPQVNFLLNGNGVERRTNISQGSGPQLPTDVTTMLRYGPNLLQAIGHFEGNYIIAVAIMSVMSSFDAPVLQDYVQPSVAAIASDAELIEGPSRISLNCPISCRRIQTPVKGCLCKHHQCFDYENFLEINSRRPSWRCPHCNQPISCTDLRIDQNMVKILREVGEDISNVIISADGSWKVIVERDGHTDELQSCMLAGQQDELEHCESMLTSNILSDVVDLTMEETDENDATMTFSAETSVGYANQRCLNTCESEDRKPFQDYFPENISHIAVASSMSEAVQEATHQEDNFWSRVLSGTFASNGSAAPISSPDAYIVRVPENFHATPMLAPVLTDAVSPTLSQEPVSDGDITQQRTSFLSMPQLRHLLATENLQLQQIPIGNTLTRSDNRRPSVPRSGTRDPTVIQGLPAQEQVPNSHQRPLTNILCSNSMMPDGTPSLSSQALHSMAATLDGDMERQHISRPQMNHLSSSGIASSPMQLHSVAQNQGPHHIPSQSYQQVVNLPGPSQLRPMMPPQQRAGAIRPPSTRVPWTYRVPHHGHPPNIRAPQMLSQTASPMQQSTPPHLRQVQQGAPGTVGLAVGSTRNKEHALHVIANHAPQVSRPPGLTTQVQAPRTASSRLSMGEQIHGVGGVQPVSMADNLPENNWRPTGRMRGSLLGQAYSAALNQYIVQSTPPLRPPPHLQVLSANSANVHAPLSQTPSMTSGSSSALTDTSTCNTLI